MPVHRFWPVTAGLFLMLAACGGGGGSSSGSPSSLLAYTIGGTVSGLSGTLALQDDLADNLQLSSSGTFTFPTPLVTGSVYSVTIAAQPSGSTCAVSYGEGAVSANVTSVVIECNPTAASGRWAWFGGSSSIDASSVYGTKGVTASTNQPSAREAPNAWTDANGNFWLFGGLAYDSGSNGGLLNDLWEYQPALGQWVWISGSSSFGSAGSYGTQGQAAAANTPGAREAAGAWTDSTGQLWLFGGLTAGSSNSTVQFNDLWRFQPTTGQWTWMGGSNTSNPTGNYGTQGVAASGNVPPPRGYPVTWVDKATGILWLFGGEQADSSGVTALFNDLWSYDPTTGLWTWVSGPSSPNAAGTYGTEGTAATTNVPGSRAAAMGWVDSSGNLWMMGGSGTDQAGSTGLLNDLWRYSPTSGEWTWMGGAATVRATSVYGSQGVAAAGNAPGSRAAAMSWTDPSGNFWLFGGIGYDQSANLDDLSDLWEYNPGVGQWTWVSGSAHAAASGNYGAQGVAASGNLPGAREQAAGWLDGQGNLWLFGGYGVDSMGSQDDLNDLWSFAP
ncbi:MAG TPA: kelch repeat-containing protein [Steroidobacteraceae bacterium]|nr:kelch repeat-containing protein [Steroidobacteraceae bacterium]